MTNATWGAMIPSPLGGREAHARIGHLAREASEAEDLLALRTLADEGLRLAARFEGEGTQGRYRALLRAIEGKLARHRTASLTGRI